MTKLKTLLRNLLPILLSTFIIAGLWLEPALAAEITNEELVDSSAPQEINTVQEPEEAYNAEEDSTFVLTHSDVQISDSDYFPETADIHKAEEYSDQDFDTVESQTFRAAAGTVGDPMVYYTQKWLNQEYGDVPGFGSVPENGKTGWPTVYGLLRALQHELGITGLSDSFGATTSALYSQAPLHRQDGVTDRKFAILQGALWCKGYSPGYYVREENGVIVFDEIFNESVERAVIELKQDAGFVNPNGTVTLNIMKALMSMDTFKLLSSYGGKAQIRTMQQKLNRKYEAYTGLTPCDGVYGRNTNRAIVYALQAEEGLPVDVATGNFGDTTKLCCPRIPCARNASAAKSYQGAYYSSSQISAFVELLQFSLYANGFGDGVIDGVFDSATQQALRDFQKHHAIPVTGTADVGTWLSLFISCGDRSRSALACDCATILTAAKAKTLYDNGYRYVGRYLTGTYNGGISKALTKTEAQIIFDAGMRFFPIYQTSARQDTYFTEAQGTADAEAAIAAASALGLPNNTIIYFAVDFDAMDYQITDNIIPYFRKVHERMSEGIYKTGIYGARNICSRVSAMGYSCSSFVGDMSTGFSGNLGFQLPDDWAFDQFANLENPGLGSGDGYIEIDKNAFSGRDQGVSRLERVNVPSFDTSDFSTSADESDTVQGPSIDILGFNVPLFELDLEFGNLLAGSQFSTNYNHEKQTLELIYGLKTDTTDPKVKTEAYAEIKSLINALGKKTTTSTWNKFQKLRSKLSKAKMQFGFEFDTSNMLYAKFDVKTGTPRMIEGGGGIIAEAAASISYPLCPIVYAKFELEGSLEAGLRLVLEETGQLALRGNVGASLTPKLGVEVDILIARAYAGISGELAFNYNFHVPPRSLRESMKLEFNAAVFFEWSALMWADKYEWNFFSHELYPSDSKKSANALSVSGDNMQFIQPLPQTRAFRSSTPGVFKENMQIYCSPKIISLGGGKMLMTYIDDLSGRTAENRTTLMYSVFNGSVWSTPQPVSDDGTADFEPVISSDGNGGAHILWQNGTRTFNPGVTLEEMSTAIDLNYIHWNGSSFDNASAITNNNNDMETPHKIISSGNNISVIWQQNSENDVLGSSGTNSIFRKQFAAGNWQNTETISSGLQNINSVDSGYIGSNNVIAYTTKTNSNLSTINDLEVFYFDGTQTSKVTNDDIPDYSVKLLNDELYWISGNSIASMTIGDEFSKKTVVENFEASVSEIKVVENMNDTKAIVWEPESDSDANFYGIHYDTDTDSFGNAEPLSTDNGVIRGWDACMLPSGKMELAYCFAEKFDEPVNGNPYGRIDLMQQSANEFYDISVNPIATYEGEVNAEQEIIVFTDISNVGSLPIDQIGVNIIDSDNNVVQTLTIDKDLPVGESAELEIPFTLPSVISRSDFKVEILPSGGTDVSLSDNEAAFSVGFADLVIEEIQEVRTNTERQLKVIVKNQGFDTVDSAEVKLLEGSIDGEMSGSGDITQLEPSNSVEFTFNIDESNLDSDISEDPISFYLLVETSTDEADYGNNSIDVNVYPDYSLNLTAGTGGTVEGSGKYENGSFVSIIATPESGYIFDGWYEDGNILYEVPSVYELTLNSNRTLEARFKPNDLKITSIEIFGSIENNDPLTFTVATEGGVQPLIWEFYVYGEDGETLYSDDNSFADFFSWNPFSADNYTIVAYCTDTTGKKVSYTMTSSGQVTGVTLNKTAITLNTGNSENLIATVAPDNAVNKVVTWLSSDDDVASVDQNGTITANSFGIAIITATIDGQIATCEVTVYSPLSIDKYQEYNENLIFSSGWLNRAQINKFDGHVAKKASNIGETLTFTFEGDYFGFLSCTSYAQGRFNIYVDGEKITETPIDLYRPSAETSFQVLAGSSFIPYGVHTVKLVLVEKNPLSIDQSVYIDAVEIHGEFVAPSEEIRLADDSITVRNSEPITIDALSNDIISNGTEITAFTQPESGSVVFENGVFVFTPTEMYVKDDSFTYSIGNSTAMVTLEYADIIRYEQNFPAVMAGLSDGHAWETSVYSRYSGGSVIRSSQKDDTITVDFYGTGIEIIGYKSWSRGIVDITVDGITTTVDTFDMSYDKTYDQSIHTISGLAPGNHTLTIKVTGDRFFLASSNAIDIDAFVVSK